jgi:hypothetical protein
MNVHIIRQYKNGQPIGRTETIEVIDAYVAHGCLVYRRVGNPHLTHYRPLHGLDEIAIENEADDPDPMRPRAGRPATLADVEP